MSTNLEKIHKNELNRRAFNFGAAGIATVLASVIASTNIAESATIPTKVHRHDQKVPFPVNAYIIEGAEGLVAVDATLTKTSSTAFREAIDAINKPLKAVLLTHPHPDHYAGLGNVVNGLDVPIVSVLGVNDVARRDDAAKNAVIGKMFQDEWPANRTFPNQIVKDGDTLDFGPGLKFHVVDIGPAESHHDSMFVLEGGNSTAFAGDIAYSSMHAYMADGHNPDWKKAIDRFKLELPEDLILHVGHGAPVTTGFLQWQNTYLDLFDAAIMQANWINKETAAQNVTERMKLYLPNESLLFFMQLSIEPNARRLGKL